MTDYIGLVKALRDPCPHENCVLSQQAADAIEELMLTAESYKRSMEAWADEAASPKWIPVTERLPEDRHDVLVYAGVMFPYITVGYYDGLWKFSFNDEEIAGSADYWMPLPEPPKEDEA